MTYDHTLNSLVTFSQTNIYAKFCSIFKILRSFFIFIVSNTYSGILHAEFPWGRELVILREFHASFSRPGKDREFDVKSGKVGKFS